MANLLDSASILLTPTATNNGSILAIQPSDGSGDMTFSRGSSATRVNAQGLIENIASNLPRIDYTDGCGSWLLEPQSTNLIPYSEDFSFFTNNNSTTSLNTTTSPLGNTTAHTIVSTTSSTFSGIYEGTNSITAGDYTFSVWLKSSNITSLSLRLRADSTQLAVENITITNSWARYSITATAPITSVFQSHVFLNEDGISGVSNVGDEVYIWGAQIEENSYPTSYIPTSGVISTRLADIATNSGIGSLINSEEGTLYFEGSALVDSGVSRVISINDGTYSMNNSILFSYSQGTNRLDVNGRVGGVYQFIFNRTITDTTINHKFAVVWKVNRFELWVDGVMTDQDLLGSVNSANTFTKLQLSNGNTSNPFYGKTKAVAVYKTALTDEQLTALTTI